jgi:hypothetical protein
MPVRIKIGGKEAKILVSIFTFFLLSLATFRLTRLLTKDKITESFRALFLKEVTEVHEGVEEIWLVPRTDHRLVGWIGELITCYWCTGIWSAMILYVFIKVIPVVGYPLVMILATASVASLLEMYTNEKWVDEEAE